MKMKTEAALFGTLVLMLGYTEIGAITELEVVNIITKCLFTTVKGEPFNLVRAFQLPETKAEKCFARCTFLDAGIIKDGKIIAKNGIDPFTIVYGQRDKIEVIANHCEKEAVLSKEELADPTNCNSIDPLLNCFDKYAKEVKLDRTKRI